MAPVTEIAYFPLKAGTNVKDVNSQAGQSWANIISTVLDQDGAQRGYFGMEVENPSMLRVFVDWDTVEQHRKFLASDTFKTVSAELDSIQDGEGAIYNAPFSPHPPSAALSNTSSPITEIFTLYFPLSYSSVDQASVERNVQQLITCIKGNADGYTGSASGWVIDNIPIPKTPSKEAKAYVAVIGWESVEAHMAFRETQTFQDQIRLVRGAKDLRDSGVVHASLFEVQKGTVSLGC